MLCFVTQSCLTLFDLIDCSLPGSSVLGDSQRKNTGVGSLSLLQRIFSTQESNWGLLHCRWILYQLSYQVSPVACQAPLSMEFPRQEYWKGLPFPSPGDLPHPGVEPGSPALPAETSPSEPSGKDIEDKENKQILGDRRGCT